MNLGTLLDRIGGVSGAICAVHCALAGLAYGVLSASGLGYVVGAQIDLIFVAVSVGVGSLASVIGWRRHGSWKPSALFAVGLGLLALAKFGLRHDHGASADRAEEAIAAIMSVLGGGFLVWFHVSNSRIGPRCPHCGGRCGLEVADAPEVSTRKVDA